MYQNDNDNSQQDFNIKQRNGADQRTSKTEELCKTTSKCQYERLSQTGKMEGDI
jgi:hypothetical protein